MGLVGGYYLHQFLIAMIAPDAILFYPKVGLGVFIFPVGRTDPSFGPVRNLC